MCQPKYFENKYKLGTVHEKIRKKDKFGQVPATNLLSSCPTSQNVKDSNVSLMKP